MYLLLRQRNSTMYNEKLKRAYIRVNYVSKSKIQESEDKAEMVTQRRGWLLLRDLIPPQCFCTPVTQAAKEPNLSLAPLKERCREPEVDEPSPKICLRRGRGADGGESFF